MHHALLLSLIGCSTFLHSQTRINNQKLIFWGINSIHTGINTLHHSKLQVNEHRNFKVHLLDSKVPLALNKKTARISDIAFVGTAITAGVFLLGQVPKDARLDHSLRVMENAWITYNITETFKNTVKRVRPYAYQGISKKDDIRSFISGHSSLTANLATSLWLSQPKNKTLPIIATGLAVGTAALRVKAGKHFVSDVLSGIVVGFGVAFIHEKIAPINRP